MPLKALSDTDRPFRSQLTPRKTHHSFPPCFSWHWVKEALDLCSFQNFVNFLYTCIFRIEYEEELDSEG